MSWKIPRKIPQLCLLILGCFAMISTVVSSQTYVRVEQGDILGETVLFKEDEFINVEKEINIFKGIPYAEPPVDELRFKPPVKKTQWEGIWNATYNRLICHQSSPYDSEIPFEQNEDCLFLTVYAPNPKPLNAAVLVWMHGGGFTSGSGSQYEFIGTPMVATGDVILVNINYRLGVFGFLTTGDESSPGNYGMLDQVEALRWVQQNIHAFGGDPSRVTIFGESAGAISVDQHLYSKLSEPLFERAIIESGYASKLFTTDLDAARTAAFQLGTTLGCTSTTSEQLVECLTNIPAQELLQASIGEDLLATPAVDGLFLEDTPLNLLEKRQFKRASLLLGNNAEENTIAYGFSPVQPSMTRAQFEGIMAGDLAREGYTSPLLVEAINQVYINWALAEYPDADYFFTYVYASTDYIWVCNMDLIARRHALVGDDVYLYHYTHASSVKKLPQWTLAMHTDELQYVFGLAFNPVLTEFGAATDDEKRLAVNVMKYWTNFAKTGNPNKESVDALPYTDEELSWPLFTIPELQYKELKVNLSPAASGLRAEQCHFWNNHLPQLGTFVGDLSEVEKEWREDFNTWKYEDMENWREEFNKYKESAQL